MTSDNCSVSKSGSTLTVKINGTSYSLTDTDTWRPVVDNLISTDTDKSLSANQGKVLKGYIDTLNGYFDASGNAKSALKLTTVSKTAWGQTFWTAGGIPASIDGDMTSVGDISFSASGKNIGGFLYFDTITNRLGINQSSPSYALDVNGDVYATGGVTCLSDIRKKDVIEREVKLSIDDIANAPLIYYSLKGEKAHKVRLGSVAQYWANILPETVNKGADGVLSMQYDVQALTSVIALAREVKRLKEEVERLKKN
jgi:hypothetical protein